jgi:anti-anti-sigma factor
MNEQNCAVIPIPRFFSRDEVRGTVVALRSALASGVTRLTIDFSGTEHVDSFGIGQLIAVAKEAKVKGAHLTLSHLNDAMYQLFADTGLDRIFAIEGVRQEVIDLFASAVDVRLDIKAEQAGDVCILKLTGVMDNVGGSHLFRQKILFALSDCRRILLDLSELTFFDSLSVAVLLEMYKLLKETVHRCVSARPTTLSTTSS